MNSTEATVRVDGRHVTIQFDMPFVPGDVCITPGRGLSTAVCRAPETRIDLVMDGQQATAKAFFGGAWYTADHTQCHGVGEFLPNRDAFLQFWLGQKADSYLARLEWLERVFANDTSTRETLRVHRLNLLRGQIEHRREEMASASLIAARDIVRLEAELAALEPGKP